ncbi:MAG: caspase, EACC1-associated type [Microcoleus sp.]
MAKFALLIGVGHYEHPDYLKPLVSAPKDVNAMQRILLNPEMGNFTEVIPLIDPEPMQMQEAIETLYRDRAKDDLVLLFFSGHGIKDDSGKLYFATPLTRQTPKGELIQSKAVSARFVQEIMGKSKSRRQVLILDCCFSGAFDPALNAKDDGSVDVRGQLGAEGRVVLTSSSSTQYSFEQQGSDLSIYTRFLVEGIETGTADLDNDGKVSVQELHEYARKKVQETAPTMNPKIIVLKDEGFDVVFAKAHITDPKLKYRREVECYSSRGELSPAGRTVLNKLRVRLGLTLEEAKEIEDRVLQPFRDRLKHLEEYRLTFVAEVERQYPLTQETLNELKGLQKILGLRNEDVTQTEEEVTTAYRQRLKRYEQFTRVIQAKFPLSQPISEELDKCQVDLGLSDENVRRIKQPIIERRTSEYKQQQLEQQRQQQQDAKNLRQRQEVERLQQQETKRLKERAKQQKEKLESQPAKLQKRDEVKQQKKSSQTKENFRSSSSSKLRLAGAFFSSILITAGGLFYFNLTHPQPQLIVEKSINTSPTPPTKSSPPPPPAQSFLAQAKEAEKEGNLGEAIEKAKLATGAENSEAQSRISTWQAKWKEQQDAFEEFEAAYKDGDLQKAYDIAYETERIPKSQYWNNHQFDSMAKDAKNLLKKAHTKRKKVCELAATQRAEEQTNAEAGKNQATVSDRPSAEEFIEYYYATIRSGNTNRAWKLLTECFKQGMNPDGLKPYYFNEYAKFWLEIEPKVLKTKTIKQTQGLAEIEALLVYQGKTKQTSETSRFSLVWDSEHNTWQIDKNEKIKTWSINSPPPNNSMQRKWLY